MFVHICSATGIAGMAVFPAVWRNAYLGLAAAAVLYAIGGGVIEVLLSPIVEACPTKKKDAFMSLLHSLYCWRVCDCSSRNDNIFYCFWGKMVESAVYLVGGSTCGQCRLFWEGAAPLSE